VARMVITATLVMLLSMTFRLPYGAYGAIYALILSRESLQATATAVRMVIIGFGLAGAYILIGMTVALGGSTYSLPVDRRRFAGRILGDQCAQ
jgi:multidrug resistance protein MdtO